MMASTTWDGSDVSGNYDVIVIGAGIMGSCTAYEIEKRGLRVLLLEQFDFLHRRGTRLRNAIILVFRTDTFSFFFSFFLSFFLSFLHHDNSRYCN